MIEPFDRRLERVLASGGLLDDAVPMFGAGEAVPRAGVLLAMAAVAASGVLDGAEEVFGTIGPPVYGLPAAVVTMALIPYAIEERSQFRRRVRPGRGAVRAWRRPPVPRSCPVPW